MLQSLPDDVVPLNLCSRWQLELLLLEIGDSVPELSCEEVIGWGLSRLVCALVKMTMDVEVLLAWSHPLVCHSFFVK